VLDGADTDKRRAIRPPFVIARSRRRRGNLAVPNVGHIIPVKWFSISFDKSWYNLMSL